MPIWAGDKKNKNINFLDFVEQGNQQDNTDELVFIYLYII